MWLPKPYETRCGRGPFPRSVYIIDRCFDEAKFKREYGEKPSVEAEEDATEKNDLMREFVGLSNKSFAYKEIRRRTQRDLITLEKNLEMRRQKLKELRSKEDEYFKCEIKIYNEDLTVGRRCTLLKDVQVWKENEEIERQDFVKMKLKEQFVRNYEPIKSKISKEQRLLLERDRMVQMREKLVANKNKKVEEGIFDQLNQADIEAKRRAAEELCVCRHMCTHENVEVLRKQMAAKLEEKRYEKWLKEEEARYICAEMILGGNERDKLAKEQTKKNLLKKELDDHKEMLKTIKSKELRENLSFERYMEDAGGFLYNKCERNLLEEKNKRRTEQLEYLDYLAANKEAENEKERRTYAEIEKILKKDEDKYDELKKQDEEYRRDLMCDALHGRLQQIRCKEEKKAKDKEEKAQEDADMIRRMIENDPQEKRDLQEAEKKAIFCRNIRDQIEYRKKQEEERQRLRKEEENDEIKAEKELQAKEDEVFNEITSDKFLKKHPHRKGEILTFARPPTVNILKKLPSICKPKIDSFTC